MRTLYESILASDKNIETNIRKTLESYEIFKDFVTRLSKVLKQHELKIDGDVAIFKGRTPCTFSQYKTTVEQRIIEVASKVASKRRLSFDEYGNDLRFFEPNKSEAFVSIEYLFINDSPMDKKVDRLQFKFTNI